jgi:hypothetical protein
VVERSRRFQGTVPVDLVPFIIGAAVVPILVNFVVLLLRGDSWLAKAFAFVFGSVVVRLAPGIVFGLILGERDTDNGGDDGSRPVLSTLLLVLGILMLITAVRKLLREEDPDAPPPARMAMFASADAAMTLGFGTLLIVVLAKQWVFTSGAISTIREGGVARAEAIQAYLLFTLGASALLLLPVLIRVVLPTRSEVPLDAVGMWLERNSRLIAIAVSVIFGTYFLAKGISDLTGCTAALRGGTSGGHHRR